MLPDIIKSAKKLPDVENYFSGRKVASGFGIPSSILLFCHDFCWPENIISSRYMLIIPFVELTYLVEGEHYVLQPGDALLVNPYLHRSVPDLHQDYLRLIISFEAPLSQDYLPESPLMKVTDAMWQVIDRLLGYYLHEETPQALLTLTLLLYELSKNSIKSEKQQVSGTVRSAMALINQYLKHSFSIKEIAGQIGVSASHLRRVFRLEIGMSLGEYMARHRLDAARCLLTETAHPVRKVAEKCGYDTIFSFTRFFKKRTGMSPSEFRKSLNSA